MMIYGEKKPKICVLISCMHQSKDIIERTHIQTNVVVINQCDDNSVEEWTFVNYLGELCRAKFISTKERGLSKSRNMAICNAEGDICLICDDDEELVPGYEQLIVKAYESRKNADVITFMFTRKDKTYPGISLKHNLKTLLKTSSVEITFLTRSILDKHIRFDEKMGSGSGNGAGEENMFLMDCKRNGLIMYYFPWTIGKLLSTNSLWFHGYTNTYFENFGWSSRRILGPLLSIGYLFYWITTHRKLYINEMSVFKAAISSFNGWRSKR